MANNVFPTARTIAICALLFGWVPAHADDRSDLQALLIQFLRGAATDLNVHQRFWADDLVYTSSAGKRFGKQHIVDGMANSEQQASGSADAEAAGVSYRAEDTDIRLYGDMAVVAFKLVAEEKAKGNATTTEFFNTGTFAKRQGEWRAVAWQATRIPEAADGGAN